MEQVNGFDTKSGFPELIDKHPKADIAIGGLDSRLIQAGDQQFIFMEFSENVEVPTHAHNAQWGVVLAGKMELTIDGKTSLLTRGDSYFIDKDVPHSAKIYAGYKDLTLFDQKDRYQISK
jgi:quercetin dioxygenase-like cupin family protein